MDMASPTPFMVLTQMKITSTGKNRTCYDSGINEEVIIFAIFTIFFSVLGMLGNGLVIWLLGSSMKRNTFATYIINLSVADFGFLTFELIIEIHWICTRLYCDFPYELFQMGLLLTFNTGQFLLTVISIDRCVSVLFPIWYRCHRPVYMSTTVCAVIWAIFFIFSSVHFTIIAVDGFGNSHTLMYHFIINTVLCLPLMTISSVTLFIKICFISKSQRRRQLLTAVLLTLFFFLVFGFPLNAFYFILCFSEIHPNLLHYGYLCTSINSGINPVIYYLVGRQKSKTQRNVKVLLQRVFKEEENSTDQIETSGSSKI